MRYFVYIAVCVFLTSCAGKGYLVTSFHEPADAGLRMLYSFDGKHWTDLDTVLLKPTVGNQQVMRDPSMVQGPDGTFHLVWTSSWRGDKGFGYASSKDLIHWSEQRLIPVMAHEPTTVNVWAPEIFYDGATKTYSIIWASCIPGRFEKGQEADSNNHRMYISSTKDFQTFSPTQLFLDPGFSVIDAVMVQRAANDFVLVLKDNTRPERNLKVAFSNSINGPWEKISAPFSDAFTEGPTVVKLGNQWLIYFDSYQKKIYEAFSTTDFQQFANVTNEVLLPQGHKHGTIVPVKRTFIRRLIKNTK